jgi:tetratricopeptide (TPR) repeat protein
MSDIDLAFARARRYHEAGQLELAERSYRQLLEGYPDHAATNHMLGVLAVQGGDPQRAVTLIETALATEGDNHEYQSSLAGVYLALGQNKHAVAGYRRVVEARADHPEAHFNLGFALASMGRREEAAAAYRRAVAIQPDYFHAWNNLGALLLADGRGEEAIVCLRRLVELRPQAPSSICNLARALEMANQLDEAGELVGRVLALNPHHAQARLLMATIERRQGRTEEARHRLIELIDPNLSDPAIAASAFLALGLVLDQKGEYARAFRAFRQGNSIRGQLAEAQEPERLHATIERYRDWFTAERMAAWAGRADDDPRPPVFFVGFPRSGTTLMEQMLAAHPDIVTTGERSPLAGVIAALPGLVGDSADYPAFLADLTPTQVEAARRAFWDSAEASLGAVVHERQLVDKTPLNIIELGLISRVLPSARIVVALRDPRDVCLSCYMQEFEQNAAMANFFDLDGTARFYGAVMNLWRHYRTAMPLPYLEYRYEELVGDPGPTLRRVLEFIGVPWAPEVLRHQETARARFVDTPSRDAVTQELYDRAVGRWRHYADEMQTVLPHLDGFVDEFGYREPEPPAKTLAASPR